MSYLMGDALNWTMGDSNYVYDPIIAPSMPPPAIISINEGVTAIGTFTAAGGSAPITYSLTGVDADKFTINSTTGVLSLVSPPDYENPVDSGANNIYIVNVVATNASGSASQQVTVYVLDVLESVPPLMPPDRNINVLEGSISVANLLATAGTPPIVYSLSGEDAEHFNLSWDTATLTFLASPDYENPHDTNGDNVYSVTITGENEYGSDTQSITVTVLDVDETIQPSVPPVDIGQAPSAPMSSVIVNISLKIRLN